MIDLHSHTTFSDGELSPETLIQLAQKRGVRALGVTDHDTVAGIERAQAAGAAHEVQIVPGIEISAYDGDREFHVLGHFVDPTFPELRDLGVVLGEKRRQRMSEMLQKLRAVGVDIPLAAVEAIAQGAQLGRPHLARALVEAGKCTSAQEAFRRYLGDGRPGHVVSRRITVAEAIALIHRAGGTASIAHGAVSRLDERTASAFAGAGLDALEIAHPDHSLEDRARLTRWTVQLGLLETAGSDYHGPGVSPGRHLGMESLAEEGLAALRARRAAAPT